MSKMNPKLDSEFITAAELGKHDIESSYDLRLVSKPALTKAKQLVNVILCDFKKKRNREKGDKSEWNQAIEEYESILEAINNYLPKS